MTTASMVRMVRSGTPLAEAAANSRSRRGASGPTSRSSRSAGVSLITVVGPGAVTWVAATGRCGRPVRSPWARRSPGRAPEGSPGRLVPVDRVCHTASMSGPGVRRANMVRMAAEQADVTAPPRRRWWHRGPFVRREVRLSVGTAARVPVRLLRRPAPAGQPPGRGQLVGPHQPRPTWPSGCCSRSAHWSPTPSSPTPYSPSGGPRRFRLFRINMSTLALSHVSPGGTAPGAALGYRLLTQSGVSGSDAGFALGTQGIGSAVVLNVMFWFSLVAFLVTHGFHVPSSHHGGQSQSASILVIVAAGDRRRPPRLLRRACSTCSPGARSGPAGSSAGWPGRIRFLDADRTTALVEQLADRFAVLMREPVPDPAGHRLGRGQLAPRRRLAVGVRGRLQPLHLARRPADGLRPGQHPGRHPHHPGRPRGGGVRAGVHDHRVRPDRRPGPVGRAGLPGRQLLAAHPLRRRWPTPHSSSSGDRATGSSSTSSTAGSIPPPGRGRHLGTVGGGAGSRRSR